MNAPEVAHYTIVVDQLDDLFGCTCCGGTGVINGFVLDGPRMVAMYVVHLGQPGPAKTVFLNLVFGDWEAKANAAGRYVTAFAVHEDARRAPQACAPECAIFPELPLLGQPLQPSAVRKRDEFAQLQALARSIVTRDQRARADATATLVSPPPPSTPSENFACPR